MVKQALTDRGANTASLQLEVSESAMTQDAERVLGVLADLRARGVDADLDDFGTGASSLRALQRLPVDEVKVDGSLVARLGEGEPGQAMVGAVISLAHSLGLRAVAEGVETAAQAEILRELGCDLAQGFFFHRPLSAEQLEALLRAS